MSMLPESFFLMFRRCFSALSRLLFVDEHLLGDLERVDAVFDEIGFEAGLQKVRHRLLHELVRDGLFRLVLVARLRGEVVGDKNDAVFDVLPGDTGFALLVFVVVLQILVDGVDKGGLRRLFGAAAVLEPRGVVVVFDALHLIRKAARAGELDLVFGLVLAVAAAALRLPEDGGWSGHLHPRSRRHSR